MRKWQVEPSLKCLQQTEVTGTQIWIGQEERKKKKQARIPCVTSWGQRSIGCHFKSTSQVSEKWGDLLVGKDKKSIVLLHVNRNFR